MTYWAKVHGLWVICAAIILTELALVTPISVASGVPSPAGANLAAACVIALAVPISVGWGCERGNGSLEAGGVRALRGLDFALAVLAVGAMVGIAVLLERIGLAPAGLITARAGLVYVGLLLLLSPLGWRLATFAPALYLLAVAVVGRGEDINHPAPWAWIAAPPDSQASWVLSAGVVALGVASYLLTPRRSVLPEPD